ncbi:MAG TPA: regulatory protein RecX [Chitinophagaceae bacterium]|jgi:regulatory protein|nr:regulatory protein RecX [Chitinophagaceae bacterium]
MYKKRLTKELALQKLRFYCRYQQRCLSEIKEKLFELGINKKDHDELMKELVKENCVSDERFAFAFASGRFKMKQWGRKKIQQGLKEKRISDEIAQKALGQINKEDYIAVLNKLAKERYALLKHEQYLVRKKKTMDYLMQKGYEVDLIRNAIHHFLK